MFVINHYMSLSIHIYNRFFSIPILFTYLQQITQKKTSKYSRSSSSLQEEILGIIETNKIQENKKNNTNHTTFPAPLMLIKSSKS